MFFRHSGLLMLSIASVAVLSACGDDGVSAPSYSIATEIENTDAIYYYQIDPELQEIRLHSNGRCRILTGTRYAWEKSADVNATAFRYTFSNDTLYLKAGGESVLVRTSGTPGSLEGTWKVVRYYNGLGYEVPGESEGLIANRQITISGNNFKETNQIASTFDFTKTMGFYSLLKDVTESQDGSDNGSYGADNTFFFENASSDLLAYGAMTNDYTILNRTNTSIEFLRKGQSFLLEVYKSEVTAFSKSIVLKVSSNGKTCVSEYKDFNMTENSCDWYVPAPLTFSHSDDYIYEAEYSNKYEFRNCFMSLFK